MSNPTSGRSIDPRFDPAFQPGYDPQSDPSRAARVPSYDVSFESSRSLPGRVVEPPRVQYEPARAAEADVSTSADAMNSRPTVGVQHDEAATDEASSDRRNPFVIALWVAAGAFIAAGVYLFNQAGEVNRMMSQGTGNEIPDFTLLQVMISSVPVAFALGFGTAIGLLFFHAKRWRGSAIRGE